MGERREVEGFGGLLNGSLRGEEKVDVMLVDVGWSDEVTVDAVVDVVVSGGSGRQRRDIKYRRDRGPGHF